MIASLIPTASVIVISLPLIFAPPLTPLSLSMLVSSSATASCVNVATPSPIASLVGVTPSSSKTFSTCVFKVASSSNVPPVVAVTVLPFKSAIAEAALDSKAS